MTLEAVPDGEYTAVVDSVADGLATVFLEEGGDEVGSTIVDASVLPETARHADAVLTVTLADGELAELTYEAEATERRQERAQNRFDRLSKRPPSDRER